MKKRKFNILLNIVVLCMCTVAIAIGVYSAKTASLNVSGTIGFNAHNCNVLITPYVTGYNGVDESSTKQEKTPQTAVELGGTDDKSSKDLTLTSLNFNDLKDDGDTIVIDLEIENKSDFAVQVTIGMPTLKRSDNTTEIAESIVTKVVTNGSNTLTSTNNKVTLKDKTNTTEKTTTITITLKVVDIQATAEEILKNAQISMSLSFEKYSTIVSYLAVNWQPLVFNDEENNSNAYCNTNQVTEIEFTNKVPTGVNLVKNSDSTVKTIKVGANALDEERTSGSILTTENIEDILVYAVKNSTSDFKLFFYSPATIYIGNMYYYEYYPQGLTSTSFSYMNNIFRAPIESPWFKSVDGHQFASLSALKNIFFGNTDFSKVTNYKGMFDSCSSLVNIDLSYLNKKNITNMSYMFIGCSALTSLDLSSFDTSSVTDMSYMFQGCKGITSLNLTSFDTSKVTDMRHIFQDCTKLTSIKATTGKWVIGSSCNIYLMFNGCGCSEVTLV